MRVCDARRLKRGDTVIWNDPDDGICTQLVTISSVTVNGDVVTLTDRDNGHELECLAEELQFDR